MPNHALVQEFRRRYEDEMETISCAELTGLDLTTPEGMQQMMSSEEVMGTCFTSVGVAYKLAVNVLKEDQTLVPYHDCFRYALYDYPARGVNLRGMTDFNVDIYCGTEIIGELDPIGARGTLYKDAIYQHLGRRYMSMELDLDKKLCRVEEVDVDYYTEAVWENRIEMTEVRR